MRRLLILAFVLLAAPSWAQVIPSPAGGSVTVPIFGVPVASSGGTTPSDSIIPTADNTYDLGSAAFRFRSVYFGTQAIGPTSAACAAPAYTATSVLTSGRAITSTPTLLDCVSGTAIGTWSATGLALTGRLTATQGTANTAVIAGTGGSLTGTDATTLYSLAGTWNTTGTPTFLDVFITDTAANASSAYFKVRNGGGNVFTIARDGAVTTNNSIVSGNTIASGSNVQVNSTSSLIWSSTRSRINAPADGQLTFANNGSTAGMGLTFSADGKLIFNTRSGGSAATQLVTTQTTVPTCSSNCGTSPSIVGSDTFMIVTMGGSGSPASGWVVTFNGTWAAAPSCVVQMAKAAMAVGKLALTAVTTTTTLTVVTNGTPPANGDVYAVHCGGIQ